MVGEDLCCHRKSTNLPPNLKKKKSKTGTGFCGNAGILANFYALFGTMPSPITSFNEEGTYGTGEPNNRLPLRANIRANQMKALGISQKVLLLE